MPTIQDALPASPADEASVAPATLEVSVVMPCLNEADTVATCVEKARRALAEAGIAGEVVVADNGSTDGSQALAEHAGARVVPVAARGYGSALAGGFAAAHGRFIIMGDADDSYDFLEAPAFVAKLREGFDLVQGCRLAGGGGRVMPGAMPLLHRWLGNPLFSVLVRGMYDVGVHDVYCGLRGFRKDLLPRLDLRCTGMEFATEMVLKAGVCGARIAEVPTTLRPDGRKAHPPHLRTFRDGWRTLRLLLVYSPRWLFLYPGAALMLLGLLGYVIAMPGLTLAGVTFDAHTLLVSSLAVLLGHQAMLFAVLARVFATTEGLLPPGAPSGPLLRAASLDRGLALGVLLIGAGILLILGALSQWRAVHFGPLDYSRTMRWVIPGATVITLGFQTMLTSFFLSLLEMKRR